MAKFDSNKVILGIELECAYPYEWKRLTEGSYHSPCRQDHAPMWNHQEDGSLRLIDFDEDEFQLVELTTVPLLGRRGLENALSQLDSMRDGDSGYEIAFNTSMGCHIHIGYESTDRFMRFLTFDFMMDLRNNYWEWIKAGCDNCEAILYDQQYSRGYARKLSDKEEFLRLYRSGERYLEFNLTKGMGLEWRSFNLLGANSFSSIAHRLKGAFTTIADTMRSHFKKGCKEDAHVFTELAFADFVRNETRKQEPLIVPASTVTTSAMYAIHNNSITKLP